MNQESEEHYLVPVLRGLIERVLDSNKKASCVNWWIGSGGPAGQVRQRPVGLPDNDVQGTSLLASQPCMSRRCVACPVCRARTVPVARAADVFVLVVAVALLTLMFTAVASVEGLTVAMGPLFRLRTSR